MNISQIVEATEPIVIERGDPEQGGAKLTLHCYLERVSIQNPEYEALLRAGRAAHDADRSALVAQEGVTTREYVHGQLFPKGKQLTPKQIDAKREEIAALVAKLAEERKATEDVVIRNKAERIAYLTRSWDVTETVDEAEQPMPVTVENLLKYFSLPLLTLVLTRIEETVFGPLV